MPFDKDQDPIAITIPRFSLRKSSEGKKLIIGKRDRYNEPYIVSMAVDNKGQANPQIDFNFETFPKVQVGDTIEMLGDGHIVYGPKHPGDFVAVSILMMESDSDVRALGESLKEIISSKAVELGMGALIAANPGSSAVLGLLKEVSLHIAAMLEKNKDDPLARFEGTFLKDSSVPFHINRHYTRSNDYVDLAVKVIPLDGRNNEEGVAVQSLDIAP